MAEYIKRAAIDFPFLDSGRIIDGKLYVDLDEIYAKVRRLPYVELPASERDGRKECITNGDRYRSMTDEDLVEWLFKLYRMTADEQEFSDLSMHWCDGHAGCIDVDGNIECDEERHKACILRWLKLEVNENDA